VNEGIMMEYMLILRTDENRKVTHLEKIDELFLQHKVKVTEWFKDFWVVDTTPDVFDVIKMHAYWNMSEEDRENYLFVSAQPVDRTVGQNIGTQASA
jgi:hypothetical protein